MSDFTIRADLLPSELVLLDGQVRPEVQAIVDIARTTLALSESDGLSMMEANMVATICDTAAHKGRLSFARAGISRCPCCGRTDGYHLVKRASKYKRKGDRDLGKPKTFAAWDLDRGFVTIKNHIRTGFCESCRDRVEPILCERLANIRVEIPEYWKDAPHRWKRYEISTCTQCGWSGHEGEMRPIRTLTGNGTYPGGCPQCDARNTPLGQQLIRRGDGFVLIERREPAP